MLDAAPTLTPAQVSEILRTTAIDIHGSGYDSISGAGRYDALRAVYKALTPAAPSLHHVWDSGVSSSDRITNYATPLITGTVPANSFVRLYVDGIERGTRQLGVGVTEFTIFPDIPLTDGNYIVTFRVAENSSTPLANMSVSSAGLALTIDTVAPKVANVTIKTSAGTPGHGPFAFNNPSDDANDFDGSGTQLRTVPVGGADTVTITLNENVGAAAGNDLIPTGLAFGAAPTLDSGGFTPSGSSLSWQFSAPLVRDQYLISLADAVTDIAGNALDGEWINPFSRSTLSTAGVSVFPSGNNMAGGDFNFVFTILPGDHELDNDVDGAGFLEWQRMLGGPGHTFQEADFNGDGYTNGADLAIQNANFGLQLLDLVYADFNHDGIVNNLDYDIWDSNYASTETTHEYGDADGDTDVDDYDLDILTRQFGLDLDWVA